MSKTDKTDPDWVRCQWEAYHHPRCVKNPGRRITYLDCDLPPEPRRGRPIPLTWRIVAELSRCQWDPITPDYYSTSGRKFYGRGRHMGIAANLQERAIRAAWRAVAVELLAVRRDDVDDVVLPDPRHRHDALWMWD
jgi:hypothetical protein